MSLRKRAALCLVLLAAVWAGEIVFTELIGSRQATALAVSSVNGNERDAARVRAYQRYSDAALTCAVLLTFGIVVRLAMAPRLRTALACASAAIMMISLTGCMREYDTPEYSEIDTSETGFLIPLEGDATGQAKFASEKYLEEKKVAAKRVQVVHRWNQSGRWWCSGQWIPTVRLVKVKRSPVTRQWTAEQATGTAAKDQAIWTESRDSVGFSMGFTCTALIREEEAAKFLYFYPSGSLADVMDSEVRARVQKVASEVSARYALDELRGRKQEIVDAVSKDVVAFFADRGITVTTIGMFGGMSYENPAIQKSIDDTFIAQQLKEIANSKFLAQQKENERVELEAKAQADSKRITAKGEADSIREINKALGETAQQSAVVLQLKSLEIERERVGRWNGQYPTYFLGGANSAAPNLVMQLPAPVNATNVPAAAR